MSDVCMELQNIKYQTMLLNSNSKVTSNKVDSLNIDSFLEKEKAVNKEKPWNKLGKNQKITKITEYINKYTEEYKCTNDEKENLKIYLVKCLERKKLQRVKDVVYDTKLSAIKNIPGLSFDKIKRKFTLKKVDKKRTSISRTTPIRKTKSKTKSKSKLNNLTNGKVKVKGNPKAKIKVKTDVKTKSKAKVKAKVKAKAKINTEIKKDKIDINLNTN